MAEEQDSQEKTEEPTQRKIDKSIEDGQFLTSKEMFVFTSVFIGLFTLVFISSLFPNFMSMWKSFFIFSLDFTSWFCSFVVCVVVLNGNGRFGEQPAAPINIKLRKIRKNKNFAPQILNTIKICSKINLKYNLQD